MSLAPGRRPLPDRPAHSDPAGRPDRPRDLSAPLPASLSWGVLVAFVAVSAVAYVLWDLPWWLPMLYAVLSVVAFAAYGLDKRAARRGAPRTSEQSLLTLGLLGGWPGAVVAQQVFRHKTRKRSFRRAFWGTVVANVVVVTALLTLGTLRGWDLEPGWLPNLPALMGQLFS